MKVSDSIAAWLAAKGIRHVFAVSGGANLHMLDSIFARSDITVIPLQNEQACAFAADAYARLTGLGCACATSGPGATNLVTGICASFFDSVPVLFLTGNVATFRQTQDAAVRQTGFQETNVAAMCAPITMGVYCPQTPQDVLPALDSALAAMRSERAGPAVVDIPDDIQRAAH